MQAIRPQSLVTSYRAWRAQQGVSVTAWALGLAGLIPFVGLSQLHDDEQRKSTMALVKTWLPVVQKLQAVDTDEDTARLVHKLFDNYMLAIASFMSAVQWGATMASPGARHRIYALSVLPCLAAWGISSCVDDRKQRYWAYAGIFPGILPTSLCMNW